MEENKYLLQPLIPLFFSSSSSTSSAAAVAVAAAASSSSPSLDDYNNNDPCNNSKIFISNNNIILRIFLVLLVAILSIWANYEASRTFDITIVNDTKDSLAGQRFDLSYVSNDKATRIVLNTSSFVEQFLYPNDNNKNSKPYRKKHIESVTLRLSRQNLNATATATATEDHQSGGKNVKDYYYVIDISPMLLEGENYNNMVSIVGAVQRAMARAWLWDGGSRAPPRLVDGMAEYIAELAGFQRDWASGGDGGLPECEDHRGWWWWKDKDPRQVARYLHYYENYKEGFIRRLNEAMRDTWHDRMVDDALGMSSMRLCGLYNASVSSIQSETRFV